MHPDTHLRESLRFGFEREGMAVAACGPGESFDPELFAEPAELVVAGGRTDDEARAILSLVRGVLAAVPRRPPVLYVGNGIARSQALAEGATEFLGDPVFVRDVVTVAKLLAGRKRDNPSILAGELGEHFGLFYLVRAISAVGRRGVLTLVRGMRRGELRFFDGEVTSAQVGLLHGLAALHQLLLWTDGRFELRPEDVVRRQQIPLEPAALFADAERFLSEICAVAGPMSPSACYERDERQLERTGRIPPEVNAVLQLFDGVRTVADVVEDCQYRVFETLRIANRLCELQLIQLVFSSHSRHKARATLAIEEWLTGDKANRTPTSSTGYVVVNKPGKGETAGSQLPAQPGANAGGVRERRRKRRGKGDARRDQRFTPPAHGQGPGGGPAAPGLAAGGPRPAQAPATEEAGGAPLAVDWAQLLPDAIGNEMGVSPVVPSSVAAGEISMAGDGQEPRAARTTSPAPPVGLVAPIGWSADRSAALLPVEWAADQESAKQMDDSEAVEEIPLRRAGPTADTAVERPHRRTEPLPDPACDGPIARDPALLQEQEPEPRALPQTPAPAPEPRARPQTPAPALEPRAQTPAPAPEPRTQTPEPPESRSVPASGAPPARSRPSTPAPPARSSRASSKPPLFTASEEAFFARGNEQPKAESFDDLDDGFDLPQSFWRRLFRSPTAPLEPARPDRGRSKRRRR